MSLPQTPRLILYLVALLLLLHSFDELIRRVKLIFRF